MDEAVHGIGDRLKAWRLTQKHTQTGAAELLGMPMRTYQNYENNVRPPNTKAWQAFHGAGININWLLSGQGEMHLRPLERANMATCERNPPAYLADQPATDALDVARLAGLIDAVKRSLQRSSINQLAGAGVVAELYVQHVGSEISVETLQAVIRGIWRAQTEYGAYSGSAQEEAQAISDIWRRLVVSGDDRPNGLTGTDR